MKSLFILLISTLAACGCTSNESRSKIANDQVDQINETIYSCDSSISPDLVFKPVFDGTPASLQDNWHSWQRSDVSTNWSVIDEQLHLKAGVKFDELVLNGAYDEFLLKFEWTVSKAGNSGVKYNIDESTGIPIGFEYQIIDDANHPDALLGINGNRKTAALYDIEPRQDAATLNPSDRLNTGCISILDGQIEHWLNGKLAIKIDLSSDDIKTKVANSKFKNVADYLTVKPGQIFLQDHGDEIAYRNIGILALP